MDCPQRRPDTPGEVPSPQTWRVERPQGCPWRPWRDPHISPKPQPNPTRVIPMTGPGFQSLWPMSRTWAQNLGWSTAQKKDSFIVDTGVAFSLLTSYSGPIQDSKLTIKGVSEIPLRPKISPPLLCQFEKLTLIHSFLIMLKCPMTLLERDLLSKFGSLLP